MRLRMTTQPDTPAAVALAGDGFVNSSVAVTVTVGGPAGLAITQAADPLVVAEGGSATFTVALLRRPSANVTVTLEQPANADVTVDTDTGTAGNQTELTFSTTQWSAPQTVTVRAAEDDADAADEMASIALRASGGDYGDVSDTVAVSVSDDDPLSLTVVGSPVDVTEGGDAGSFTVRLSHQPAATVTVSLASGGRQGDAGQDLAGLLDIELERAAARHRDGGRG